MSTQNAPKKRSEKRKRTYRKTFRMSEEEFTRFLENTTVANLSDADFIRLKCCDQKPLRKGKIPSLDTQALASVLGQLIRYGSNFNQAVKALNIAKFKPDGAAVASELSLYEAQLNEQGAMISEMRDLVRKALLNHDLEG